MNSKSFALASAAAAMFAAGGIGLATAEHHEDSAAKIHCEGVNQCKGHSDCATADNECKGLNSCKGKGYLSLTQAECDAIKAKQTE